MSPPPPSSAAPPAISLSSLSYHPPTSPTPLLNTLTLSLPPRSLTLLLGANGSGKTTLLRLLSGRKLSPPSSISILGHDPFTSSIPGITYLGLEWVLNPIVRTDISVKELLKSMGGEIWPERRSELVRVLDIDEEGWRMHLCSDGERRRVQLAMGLIRPWRVLLLDEVTVDLDLLARSEFLGWLRGECLGRGKGRRGKGGGGEEVDGASGEVNGEDEEEEEDEGGASVVYATHILDGLDGWATHLVHLHMGTCKEWGPIERFTGTDEQGKGGKRLGEVVLDWLKEDIKERGPRRGGEGKTYEDLGGRGGYGLEKRIED